MSVLLSHTNNALFTKVVKVFEASVEVCLDIQVNNTLEVTVIDVGVDSKETLEDVAHLPVEILGERSVYT